MTTPHLPNPEDQREARRKAPSPRQAWMVTWITTFAFLVGGLGLVFGTHGYFWLLYVGVGIFAFGVLYGWWIAIFEYTEEETIQYSSGMVERVEPSTKPGHG